MTAIVQSAAGTKDNVAANPTVATFSSTPADGNYILLIYMGGQSVPQSGSMAALEDPGGTNDTTGFTELENTAVNGTSQPYSYRFCAYRVYSTGDSLSYGVTNGTPDAGGLFIVELDAAEIDTADLFEAENSAFNSSTGATSLASGDVTTASGPSIIFAAIHVWESSTADQNFGHSAGWTELHDVADTSGSSNPNEYNGAIAYREEADSGTFGNTFTWQDGGTFGSGSAYIVALNTTPTGGGTPSDYSKIIDLAQKKVIRRVGA